MRQDPRIQNLTKSGLSTLPGRDVALNGDLMFRKVALTYSEKKKIPFSTLSQS